MNALGLAHQTLAAALIALIHDARAAQARLFSAAPGTPPDSEALHDFRVALRRLRTLLRVARALWGRKRLARFEGELRHYARATSALRDEEVLRETLGALELPEAARAEVGGWLVRRARAARARRVTVERLLAEGPSRRVVAFPGGKHVRPLDRSLDKLEGMLTGDDGKHRHVVRLSAAELGESALDLAAREVSTGALSDLSDPEAMHELRIREKRLRYAAEIFTAPLGARAAHLAKHATRMQKRLGELHDIDEALSSLAQARGLTPTAKDAAISALRACRAACVAKLETHIDKARQIAFGDHDDDAAAEPSPDAPSP